MEGDILLYQFLSHLQSFLFGLEGRASFAGRDSAMTEDCRVTWVVSGENDDNATTVICIAVCCCTISVDSCVVAINVLL